MLLYYITDRTRFPGPEPERRRRLLDKMGEAARASVDFIQLREKDLSAHELESLARDAISIIRSNAKRETRNVKLLINHRPDIALATGADGVHLRSDDISASDARSILSRNGNPGTQDWLVTVSCHTPAEVALAESHGADFAVFAPVFEKSGRAGSGLEALRQACTRAIAPNPKVEAGAVHPMPVLALGGITLENARTCVEAGAAGIAAIRLFQENDVAHVVARLRSVSHLGRAGVH